MSLIAGLLTQREALIATDTLVSDGRTARAVGHCSKTLTLPHLRCAFATRGHNAFASWLLVGIQNTNIPGASFDGLLPLLREVIEQAAGIAIPYIEDDDIAPKLEVIIAGWSDAAGKPVGRQFTNVADDGELQPGGFAEREIPTGYFGVPGVHPKVFASVQAKIAKKRDPADVLTEFAQGQRLSAPDGGDIGQIGGRLILTTVTKFKIEQRQIFQWPDFDPNLAMDAKEIA
jgi:hypothetical protein